MKRQQIKNTAQLIEGLRRPILASALTEDLPPETIRGERGPQGEAGPQGPVGPKGQQGERGEKGEKGDRGEQGIDGPQGPAGKDGLDGKDGSDGKDGKDGSHGIDGRNGKDGADGERGERGPQGLQGLPGTQGPAGQDGVTPVFSIGEVKTVDSGIPAQVNITGDKVKPVLNFRIPRGAKGADGWGGGSGSGATFETLNTSGSISKDYTIITGGTMFAIPQRAQWWRMWIVNASSGTVMIATPEGIGNDTSGNDISFSLYAGESVALVFDGSYWRVA